nr:hypothetical protein [uncultured Niameybacter sp.]
MENELLQQVLEQLALIQADVRNMQENIKQLEFKVDNGFSSIDKKVADLSKDISSVVSDQVVQAISDQLRDLRTEISIIKSSVGEHELDLKYFKKVTIPNFKSPSL